MTYKVKYKLKGQLMWRTVKNVKGDAMPNFMGSGHLMLIRDDESIVLLPTDGLQIEMGSERHSIILKRMENQAGQSIPVNKE